MTEPTKPPPLMPGVDGKPDEHGFYEAYAGFAKTLRAWLIAFGVGAPILFFRSPEAWLALGKNGAIRPFVYCFLSGIALQVVCALLYKAAMWYLYMEELGNISKTTKRYRASEWLSSAYVVELLFDLSTIGLFGYATIRAIQAVVA